MLLQQLNMVGAAAPASGPGGLGGFPNGLVGLSAGAPQGQMNVENFQAQKELQNLTTLTNLYKTQLCRHF